MPELHESNAPASQRSARAAPLLLVLAALLFALMAVLTKSVSRSLPAPEIAFVRFCVGLVGCAVAHLRSALKPRNRFGLLRRGAWGGAAVLCYFMAIAHLPVGVATLLNSTAPVFTALYAALFLGEPITRATLSALALATTGALFVVRGSAPADAIGFGPWPFVGLLSAVLAGAAVATIRELRRTDGSWEIFTAFCVAGALITLPPALLGWVPPRPSEWLWLVTVGLLALVPQLLMTFALRSVRAALGGVIAQLTPVAALLLGVVLFGERVGALALGGVVLTLCGVSLGVYVASDGA